MEGAVMSKEEASWVCNLQFDEMAKAQPVGTSWLFHWQRAAAGPLMADLWTDLVDGDLCDYMVTSQDGGTEFHGIMFAMISQEARKIYRQNKYGWTCAAGRREVRFVRSLVYKGTALRPAHFPSLLHDPVWTLLLDLGMQVEVMRVVPDTQVRSRPSATTPAREMSTPLPLFRSRHIPTEEPETPSTKTTPLERQRTPSPPPAPEPQPARKSEDKEKRMCAKNDDDSFHQFSEEELNQEFKDALKESCATQNLEGLHKALYENLDAWKTCDVHIAIIGETGAGKSTLINTLRNLKKGDPGYAKTGGIAETTMDPDVYTYPDNEKIKLIDLPGIGTTNFPKDTYISKINGKLARIGENLSFEGCHAFILLTKDRFKETDDFLCHKVKELNKPLFFIRGNMDTTLANLAEDERWDGETSMAETKKECLKVLTKISRSADQEVGNFLFLICNKKTQDLDFPRFLDKLTDAFTGLQFQAFILSTKVVSQDIIEKKYQYLYSRLKTIAYAAALFGGIPFNGLASVVTDSIEAKDECNYQRVQFGLDDASLEICAKNLGMDLSTLQHKISLSFASSVLQGIEQTANFIGVFVPVGMLAGALRSGFYTYREMNNHLKDCKLAAEELMKLTMGHLEQKK